MRGKLSRKSMRLHARFAEASAAASVGGAGWQAGDHQGRREDGRCAARQAEDEGELKARGGTAVAMFQMMSDFGSIIGSFGVGQIAQHLSFGWAFALSGLILLIASVGWTFAPETRDAAPLEHTPARPLGPEAAGELP